MKKLFTLTTAASLALAAGVSVIGATAAQASAETTPAHDLTVSYQSSGAKASGFAGLVGIHVKNVGSERYYGEFPIVSFRVDVHTEKGPSGVDRLITPGWFNGAYAQDLGFDEATSTRSFLVTLSNPVEKGQDQLIANLNFGDGQTREGRITNYVTVTQVGRLLDDTSTANDHNVDSRQNTVSDFGKKLSGIF